MDAKDGLPVEFFANGTDWERWLGDHPQAGGVWLKIAKRTAGITSVTYAQALEVALCHGWIDGQKKSFDAQCFLQRFTPRRPRSMWSRINIAHAERLIAAGRMTAAGLREVESARADGRWEAAYAGSASMQVPLELATALAGNCEAKAFFDTLDKTNRYAFCWRVQTAKKPATRAARAARFVQMLARGEKIHDV